MSTQTSITTHISLVLCQDFMHSVFRVSGMLAQCDSISKRMFEGIFDSKGVKPVQCTAINQVNVTHIYSSDSG